MENNNSNSNRNSTILLVLLLLSIVAGIYFWNKSRNLEAVEADNMELSAEVETLSDVRDDLVEDVEEMTADYNRLVSSNDSLQTAFATQTVMVQKKQAEISKIKKSAAKDAAGMKTEIDQLRTIRKELTALVDNLKTENMQLRQSNSNLTDQVSSSNEKSKELMFEISELKQLNAELERDRAKLMATSARTTNLRVDLTNSGDKPTTSHRRAKQITVSFNISNLPENKKGVKNLYVVLKDAMGNTVKVDNPIKANIRPENGAQAEPIIAQQMLSINLTDAARYQFKVNPQNKTLKKGYYRAMIYADWGLLGGAQFNLK